MLNRALMKAKRTSHLASAPNSPTRLAQPVPKLKATQEHRF